MADPRDPLDLLLAEAARDRTEPVRDRAEWAAVVGVERVSLVAGTEDPHRLRHLLEGRADHAAPTEVSTEVRRAWGRVAEALERGATGRAPDSGTLHREAGHHSVTDDPVLLRAALRAAHRSFETEPYYRTRYADRGARFAGSDSAWLVTLADLPADWAVGQTSWLARVLASRGMPSLLLQRHLRDLADELDAAGRPPGSLVDSSRALEDRRRGVLPDATLASAADDLRAAADRDEPLVGSAALVLAAAADVACGLADAYAPCVDWVTDPERCPEPAARWFRAQAALIAPLPRDAGPDEVRPAPARDDPGLSAGRSRAGSPAPRS